MPCYSSEDWASLEKTLCEENTGWSGHPKPTPAALISAKFGNLAIFDEKLAW